jgi:inosine-uridine nucleoside N-ribohydrolase
MGDLPDGEAHWGCQVTARPSPPGAALELLDRSIKQGATIVCIGPCTNLAVLEARRPGRLDQASVVIMGGWVYPPAAGLPAWGPEMDWNIQCDTKAAITLADHARLTMVPLPIALKAFIREAHLDRLAASGPLGVLLARQTKAHAVEHRMAEIGRTSSCLPDDLLNFHYDPVACAVALGWPGALVEESSLRPVFERGGALRFEPHRNGRRIRLVADIDGGQFAHTWISMVEAAQSRLPALPPATQLGGSASS